MADFDISSYLFPRSLLRSGPKSSPPYLPVRDNDLGSDQYSVSTTPPSSPPITSTFSPSADSLDTSGSASTPVSTLNSDSYAASMKMLTWLQNAKNKVGEAIVENSAKQRNKDNKSADKALELKHQKLLEIKSRLMQFESLLKRINNPADILALGDMVTAFKFGERLTDWLEEKEESKITIAYGKVEAPLLNIINKCGKIIRNRNNDLAVRTFLEENGGVGLPAGFLSEKFIRQDSLSSAVLEVLKSLGFFKIPEASMLTSDFVETARSVHLLYLFLEGKVNEDGTLRSDDIKKAVFALISKVNSEEGLTMEEANRILKEAGAGIRFNRGSFAALFGGRELGFWDRLGQSLGLKEEDRITSLQAFNEQIGTTFLGVAANSRLEPEQVISFDLDTLIGMKESERKVFYETFENLIFTRNFQIINLDLQGEIVAGMLAEALQKSGFSLEEMPRQNTCKDMEEYKKKLHAFYKQILDHIGELSGLSEAQNQMLVDIAARDELSVSERWGLLTSHILRQVQGAIRASEKENDPNMRSLEKQEAFNRVIEKTQKENCPPAVMKAYKAEMLGLLRGQHGFDWRGVVRGRTRPEHDKVFVPVENPVEK